MFNLDRDSNNCTFSWKGSKQFIDTLKDSLHLNWVTSTTHNTTEKQEHNGTTRVDICRIERAYNRTVATQVKATVPPPTHKPVTQNTIHSKISYFLQLKVPLDLLANTEICPASVSARLSGCHQHSACDFQVVVTSQLKYGHPANTTCSSNASTTVVATRGCLIQRCRSNY